jgi:ankyrin repeat protein
MAAGGPRRIDDLHGRSCDFMESVLQGLNDDIKKEHVNKFPKSNSDYFYVTALQVAVENSELDVVRCLLKLGADPNKKFRELDYTPLHFAVIKGRDDIIQLLMANGADPTIGRKYADTPEGQYFDTPLSNACEKGLDTIVNTLLRDTRVEESINTPLYTLTELNTPLAVAAFNGHKNIVDILKSHRAAPIEKKRAFTRDNFQDALILACHSKNLDMVTILLEDFEYLKGVFEVDASVEPPDVNYYLKSDYSALYNALTTQGNEEIVRYLLSKGAVLDPKPHKGKSEPLAQTEFERLMAEPTFDEYRYYLDPTATPDVSRVRRTFFNNNKPRSRLPAAPLLLPPLLTPLPRRSRRNVNRLADIPENMNENSSGGGAAASGGGSGGGAGVEGRTGRMPRIRQRPIMPPPRKSRRRNQRKQRTRKNRKV